MPPNPAYHVVALSMPIVYTREGDHDPNGLLFTLKAHEPLLRWARDRWEDHDGFLPRLHQRRQRIQLVVDNLGAANLMCRGCGPAATPTASCWPSWCGASTSAASPVPPPIPTRTTTRTGAAATGAPARPRRAAERAAGRRRSPVRPRRARGCGRSGGRRAGAGRAAGQSERRRASGAARALDGPARSGRRRRRGLDRRAERRPGPHTRSRGAGAAVRRPGRTDPAAAAQRPQHRVDRDRARTAYDRFNPLLPIPLVRPAGAARPASASTDRCG